MVFELNNNVATINATCPSCFNRNRKRTKRQKSQPEIELNTKVIAKYNYNQYAYGQVIEKTSETLHHVQFVDTTAENIKSLDILVSWYLGFTTINLFLNFLYIKMNRIKIVL